MGDVSRRDGSREVVRLMAITQLKMKDACSLCNMIEIFCQKKSNQDKKKKALWSFPTPNGIGTIV
jgi:hypothetical protein